MMHELIDREEPKCLFCQSETNVDVSSNWDNRYGRMDTETLTCRSCKEIFVIHSNQDTSGETRCTGFAFSCKGVLIYYDYDSNKFWIGNHQKNYKSLFVSEPTIIPYFSVDFSDKNKLHEKLKTYLIFS